MTGILFFFSISLGEKLFLSLIIKASGFILIKVSIVSLKDSPFDKELFSKLIFIELCPSFLAANSKLIVVLVDGSKNKLKIFLDTFLV